MDLPAANDAPPPPPMEIRTDLEPWTQYPYRRLILTDLEQQPPPSEGDDNQDEVRLHQATCSNTQTLCDGGASGPFFGISGFVGSTFTPFVELRENINYSL
eukprot:5071738-Pyramimonas_sp.AAC.1